MTAIRVGVGVSLLLVGGGSGRSLVSVCAGTKHFEAHVQGYRLVVGMKINRVADFGVLA